MSRWAREDYVTHTEADAGAWARAHADDYDVDRPTARELAEDAELDRQQAARPRQVNPQAAHWQVASELNVDIAHALVPIAGVSVSIDGLVPAVCELTREAGIVDHPIVGWLQKQPRWEVRVDGGRVFVRPAGGELEVGPPF
jgi:hypothetical protein